MNIRPFLATALAALVLAPLAFAADDSATLDAPESTTTGETVSIKWTGPNREGDIIAIVSPETESSNFGVYAKTSAGNPAKIEAPDTAGKYEIRYVTGGDIVLATRPLALTKAKASVTAPAKMVMGANVEIPWTGPNEEGDFIALVLSDAVSSEFGGFALTKDGNPAKLTVPAEPGMYDVRYVRGSDSKILAIAATEVITPDRAEEIQEKIGE